ncbi:response regulator [Rhodanobacter sp. FDAARGOS 1247]|uniref:ATP-binding protein n=1 Tax=Rhodanobacter sp. FDAARGOS 1247 TaxID=2778082 RepID=UPI00194F0F99|nr:ATP-binding protein [Rhodanobacter sp. FDAARGOS 1247]QRP63292.1 response regulator [Rhodanobacter sp. FDAARGOS 1247]
MKTEFGSIREKLQAIVVLATVAALVCATLGNIVGNVVSYHYRHVSDVSTTAELLGRMTAPALQFDDEKLAHDNLLLLAARPNVRAAAIYTDDDRLFAGYIAEDQREVLPAKIERSGTHVEGTALVVTRQIVNDGVPLGKVYLKVGYNLVGIVAGAIGVAVLVGLLSVGIALVLIRRMERLVTAPIAAVASIAREVVEQQDYSRRVAKTTHDEVGELVDSFNDMLAEVERRTEALQASYQDVRREAEERQLAQQEVMRLNASLEHRVDERTADLQRANQELTAAKAAADEASRAKSSFLATMSHEIRTPMNGVIGMIDVLQQTELKGHQVEMLELIRESAFSLLTVIDDILDFSKIESGRLELEQAPFSLREMAENACGMLANLALKKGVYLTLFIDPAIPSMIVGDALRLRQVLVNLVSNAIKFSSGNERPGRVAVRVRLDGHCADGPAAVALDVIDNGIGIEESTRARLFTAFSQADTSTTRRFGGTGLGLAISRRLVELMEGTLALKSEVGQGSTFSVHLSLPSTGQEAPAGSVPELAGLRCLVVGRVDGLAADLAAYLAAEGAHTHQAADVAQACELIKASPPGRWIGVIDASDAAGDEASLRAFGRCAAEHDLRIVAIGRGSSPQGLALDKDLVWVDGNVLTRRRLCRVVNLAAGRAPAPAPAGRQPGKLDAPSREEARQTGRLVLVAEDDATNQKVILRQLELLGIAAEVASDGKQALDLWRSGDYGLLLTDLHMPTMDGYELTRAIRAHEQGKQRMPIAALTATALKGESERCHAAGMDKYLTKPLQLADLRVALAELLPALPRPAGLPPDASADEHGAAVNLGVLEELVGSDPAVIVDLLQSFRDSAGHAIEALRAACGTGDMATISEQAHRLKSSARTIGAIGLSEFCAQIEIAGKAGAADVLAQLLPGFDRQASAVDAFLANFLEATPS